MAAPQAKGGLGWAILAAALAIPGLLFYNWWSHLKAERQKSISQKARGRVPETGVFATPAPDADKLVNPVAASTAAPVAASTAAPAGAAAVPAAVAASSAPVMVAALPRDPTLSPSDIMRMQQEEMERQLAEEAMRRAMNEKKNPPKKREVPIHTYVDLQGIVANADGENKAIVNDVVVGVGETFDARGHEVKILKINAAGVTFAYKGKRFTKNVSRDE